MDPVWLGMFTFYEVSATGDGSVANGTVGEVRGGCGSWVLFDVSC